MAVQWASSGRALLPKSNTRKIHWPASRCTREAGAVPVLSFMARDRHIDIELFQLFLSSGVYLEYARKYLAPEQLDEVDVQAFLQG